MCWYMICHSSYTAMRVWCLLTSTGFYFITNSIVNNNNNDSGELNDGCAYYEVNLKCQTIQRCDAMVI